MLLLLCIIALYGIILWGYVGIVYVIDILEKMRDNKKNKRN